MSNQIAYEIIQQIREEEKRVATLNQTVESQGEKAEPISGQTV